MNKEEDITKISLYTIMTKVNNWIIQYGRKILLWFWFIIIFVLLFFIYPMFASNAKITEFWIIHEIDSNFHNESSIFVIEKDSIYFPLYTEVLFKYTDWVISEFSKHILAFWHHWNGSIVFHEYLHFLYLKQELTNKDKEEIIEVIRQDKYQFPIFLSHVFIEDDNINYWLTEYISHKYDDLYDRCQKNKDDITNILIKKKVLPNIYCKK